MNNLWGNSSIFMSENRKADSEEPAIHGILGKGIVNNGVKKSLYSYRSNDSKIGRVLRNELQRP